MHSPIEPSRQASPAARKLAVPQKMWRRLLRTLGLVGLGAASSAAAPAQPFPQHWMRYAQLASAEFQARLGDPADASALRMQDWMQARALPGASLVMRVWLAPDGRVARMEFDSLGNPQADADLRAVLMTKALPEPPPPDMRQPMVLGLGLDGAQAS
ncbi:hypothetical protein [Cupriavidus basilensis]|uniref:Uncharacterized protein n=1 Tax=Cupriavidus basilensis TaxID=68895 RepID=A0A0C4YC04_9BURK|nr:hypothetical protein [Cupriavidus basilensis]AJG20400.1 hypothetical protein RR42_m3029 [Cupriavidus basilensis]